ANTVDGGIACLGDDAEDLAMLRAWLGADEGGPGQVAVDGPRLVELGPQVHQDEVALLDRRVTPLPWRIMWIAAVRADGADRRMIGEQVVLAKVVEDDLLHLGLAHRAALAA